MFHPHTILNTDVDVLLEDVHTEPGQFVDSEHGQTTNLLVGRCRFCGVVYLPMASIPPHTVISAQIPTTTETLQLYLWGEGTHYV